MSHCHSCGRYVGPHHTCPYCGASMTGRVPIRVIKLAAILLSVVGLAILWVFATRAEIPTVAVGQVGASMNLAYVRVEGRCTRAPSYDPETGYLSFWVGDDTGELYVSSYRAETQALIEQGNVPGLGDHVAVAGTLRIREDFPSLTVNAPGAVTLARDAAEACPIGRIASEQTYRRVRVRGQVRDVFQPYPGLMLITVRDETGSIDVALTNDVIALSGITPTVEIGQSIEVEAAVSQYRGTPQLVLASASDLVLLDDAATMAERRFVMELSADETGTWVVVGGTVAGVEPFSQGVKLALDDGSGVVTVLLWQDVYQGLKDEPALGTELEVQGELAEYRGELEVIPELAAEVRVVAAARPDRPTSEPSALAVPIATPSSAASSTPTLTSVVSYTLTPTEPVAVEMPATPRGELTSLDAISADHLGREVTVQGTIVDAESFSQGFKVTLDDRGAQIVLLMWHDVYDDCWDRSGLEVGATLRTTGEVTQYQG
ncbi:MAG: hypothetical protein KGY78_00750, partial [Anaerolineae bacterium]|nr:hypothetical protein [Anaerolineae bacterium]